jgi:putative oxidoreductase
MAKAKECPSYKALGKHAHWLLRLSLAAVFLFHGLPKFQNLEGFAGFAQLPLWLATLVAIFEVGGAVLLLVGGVWKGWATHLGGLLITPVMIGAILTVHWGQWGNGPTEAFPAGGMEFQVTLLTIALWFAIVGNHAGGGTCCEGKCKF